MFGNKEKNEKRFVEKTSVNEGGGVAYIYTDTKTGVQYLFVGRTDFAGGVVIVDKDGRPLIDEDYEKYE